MDWLKSLMSYLKMVNTVRFQSKTVYSQPTWGEQKEYEDLKSKQNKSEKLHEFAQAIKQESDENLKKKEIFSPSIAEDGVCAPLQFKIDSEMHWTCERKMQYDLETAQETKEKMQEAFNLMQQVLKQESCGKLKKPTEYGYIQTGCSHKDIGSLCAQETREEAKKENMNSVDSVKAVKSTENRKKLRLVVEEHKGAFLASVGEFNSFPNDKEIELLLCSSCQQKLVECLDDAEGSNL